MASYKPVFLFFFIHFLNSATLEAAGPTYLDNECATNKTFTQNNDYQKSLRDLLHMLSSNATGKTEFYNTINADTRNLSDSIYGLFMCRGDVTSQLCHQCVHEATDQLSMDYCGYSKEAIIWYDECMVRYSNRSIFSTVDTTPKFTQYNSAYDNRYYVESLKQILLDTMNAAANEAAEAALGEKKCATNGANFSAQFESVYCLVQCTPDLSSKDCRSCLSDAIGELQRGMRGGKVLYPSCNVRYELYEFYKSAAQAVTPTPSPSALFPLTNSSNPQGKNASGKSRKIIIVVFIPIVGLGIILFCIACYFLQKKMRKGYKALLKEIFGDERTAFLKSLQFSLTTMEAATNKFARENKIGQGGSGEVYKGILPDGREIAIKRLSKSSKQGAEEFKNEVSLMAKLQHRNLVTLLGFCLEGQEKMLIYEYIPNNSLDYFLFGTRKTSALNWPERYKIIEGIAQGILYLHKYSNFKIIHRDLKLSNVLLDSNMNPKISDFGISRMVDIDETHGSTSRIAGTRGYMSPEYALFGQFSEKSDVFSFGVMLLEIFSGKKNANGTESQYADGLLNYAWRQWRSENVLEILDPSMREVGSQSEVNRCIHIGFLCVQKKSDARPAMNKVIQYLNNDSLELPSPEEPAFFIHDRREHPNDLGSINEVSASEFFPR